MTDFRDMQLITALARHRHFARAAEDCGISQPAFSARIRNLETTLGVSIVQRGNRFIGFTAQGDLVVSWAHRILADLESLHQDLAQAQGELTGRFVLGTVPTAIAYASEISGCLRSAHPGLSIEIQSASSNRIRAALETMEMDAGITYLDATFPKQMHTRHLYDERYVLVAPPSLSPRSEGEVTWREAAELPLCLLSSEMRNRQIVNGVFEKLGVSPKPVIETNAFTAALSQVALGSVATIAPERLVMNLQDLGSAVRLALCEPVVTEPIGLVRIKREPDLPVVEALGKVLDKLG